MSRALIIHLAYHGAHFNGFARQPQQTTVQGSVEEALATLLKRPVETVGAGRTDAGVHALGQVISCVVSDEETDALDLFKLRRSLEALCGDFISIQSVELGDAEFSARFDARYRVYRYRIFNKPERPLFARDFVWHVPRELDLSAMRAGAAYALGEHDFTSFCVKATAEELAARGLSLSRNIISLEIFEEDVLGERCVTIQVVGNAFLHSMVRVLVGTLAEIGQGARDPEWMRAVIAARSRDAAGQTAPAQGLTLFHVAYDASEERTQ